ncbi:MAG: ROK family protein [Candidatus Omnitrophica bacterium]|nr:ROK family protein [Candidatus Omnitrophota bacterium]
MKIRHFIGVDVGGTKISSAVVTNSGSILARHKVDTPRMAKPDEILKGISDNISSLLAQCGMTIENISGIGIGLPGIFDEKRDKVIVSPNLNIDGFSCREAVEKKYNVPAATENDVNVGLLGEHWLGSARAGKNIIGIFPGTGIGGAFMIDGRLYTGSFGAATEIGHVIMYPGGDKCGCKNRGCLEAVASRLSIERDILKAIKSGKKSAITKIVGKNPSIIKSGALKKALKMKDQLVKKVLRTAAENIGISCVNLRHILDPDVIVLGGGLIEACGDYILPIIIKTVESDAYFASIPKANIVKASLGDDAAILGAVALIQAKLGLKLGHGTIYPSIRSEAPGKVIIDNETFTDDVFIRADGDIKRRKKKKAVKKFGTALKIGDDELKKICKKTPEVLFVGAGYEEKAELDEKGEMFLNENLIEFKVSTTPDAVTAYNECQKRKAILLLVGN